MPLSILQSLIKGGYILLQYVKKPGGKRDEARMFFYQGRRETVTAPQSCKTATYFSDEKTCSGHLKPASAEGSAPVEAR